MATSGNASFVPLGDEQLAAIEARANAATPGPWTIGEKFREALIDGRPAGDACPIVCAAPANEQGYAWWKSGNAAFIAAAREDVPALVAEVRRLRRLLDAAEVDYDPPPPCVKCGTVCAAIYLYVRADDWRRSASQEKGDGVWICDPCLSAFEKECS